jgi:hypothetical protein
MIFMIPTPPTTSEIAAVAASSQIRVGFPFSPRLASAPIRLSRQRMRAVQREVAEGREEGSIASATFYDESTDEIAAGDRTENADDRQTGRAARDSSARAGRRAATGGRERRAVERAAAVEAGFLRGIRLAS